MKKIIFVFSVLAANGMFASPNPSLTSRSPVDVDFEPRSRPSFQEIPLAKEGFVYVRFSTAEGDLSQVKLPHPGLGFGYRRLAGNGAVDISVSGIGHKEDSGQEFFWAAPKVSFIHYFSPLNQESIYLGGGLAWGGVKRENQKFIGIIPNAVIGFEFFRKSSVLGFAELNVSQPAFAVQRKGEFPGLIGEVSIGAGF